MDDIKKKKKGLDEDELADPLLGDLDVALPEVEVDEEDDEWVDGKADAEEEY